MTKNKFYNAQDLQALICKMEWYLGILNEDEVDIAVIWECSTDAMKELIKADAIKNVKDQLSRYRKEFEDL